MYLSRSIRPNKYLKIKFQIGSKARLSPPLSFFLLRGKFKHVYATWQCAIHNDGICYQVQYTHFELLLSTIVSI